MSDEVTGSGKEEQDSLVREALGLDAEDPTQEGVEVEASGESAEDIRKALEEVQAENARLAEKLEEEEKRRVDTQRDWHEQQRELRHRQMIAEELKNQLDQRQRAEETARSIAFQMPEIPDKDELLTDPEKLLGLVRQVAETASETTRRRVYAEIAPFLQATATMDAVLPFMLRDGQRRSFESAKALIGQELEGTGEENDFDNYVGRIVGALEAAGPRGAGLVLEPEKVADAYWILRRSEGRKPVRQRPQPAPTAGKSETKRKPGDEVRVSRTAIEIGQKLRVDPKKIASRHGASRVGA